VPHFRRLTAIIEDALQARGLAARYTVDVYRLHDLHEWCAALKPSTPDKSALQLHFTLTENPEWLAVPNETKRQLETSFPLGCEQCPPFGTRLRLARPDADMSESE
jgi:hypothetical protein